MILFYLVPSNYSFSVVVSPFALQLMITSALMDCIMSTAGLASFIYTCYKTSNLLELCSVCCSKLNT
jgi:hypothetical protein